MDPISDLDFFIRLVKLGSLAALARELGVTPPAVSTRLSLLEKRLGVRLLNRTTRRLGVTYEGELYLSSGTHLLASLQELESLVSNSNAIPKGLLRINATYAFGRTHIAPAVSEFVRRFPGVEVQLDLTDRLISLADNTIDVGIRFGKLADSRMVARKILDNRRFLCASPAYIKEAGVPVIPNDLLHHKCIVLRSNDPAYGTWQFSRGRKLETVKVHGALTTNEGETALMWARQGHGIIIASEWNVSAHLRSGALQVLMADWDLPVADVFVVFGERKNLPAKISAFIDFLTEWFHDKPDIKY